MNKLDESLISGIPPFRKLSHRQIREILDAATSRRFEAGSTIYGEGLAAERFYLLLDGYIRAVRTTADGDQIIALHIPSGQLFGIAAALGRTTYPATAVAAAECITLSWKMSLWSDFVARYDGFATETYKVLGARLGEMTDRIVEMATKQVEQRVAAAVLRLVQQAGRKVDGGIEIDFPITRQNISDMTGTTLFTVSRLLSAWEKDGILDSGRRRITVTKPHDLVILSGAAPQPGSPV